MKLQGVVSIIRTSGQDDKNGWSASIGLYTLSWNVALEKGYEPKLYPYATEHVPLGECKAVLDFKIRAKKVIAAISHKKILV